MGRSYWVEPVQNAQSRETDRVHAAIGAILIPVALHQLMTDLRRAFARSAYPACPVARLAGSHGVRVSVPDRERRNVAPPRGTGAADRSRVGEASPGRRNTSIRRPPDRAGRCGGRRAAAIQICGIDPAMTGSKCHASATAQAAHVLIGAGRGGPQPRRVCRSGFPTSWHHRRAASQSAPVTSTGAPRRAIWRRSRP
ncbi:unnamed protein product [Acanthosepion pharaonis]|uniref:Uncharacterized protein n=1 Tax=Acanthosepion pharaonis TaxID=158019 RepID=A0A812DIC5_ACAPH|nr:unnamed protein product [Sepia pharaonis]